MHGFEPESIPLAELPLSEVLDYFDWRMFFATWGVKEDASLKEDALRLLDKLGVEDGLSIRVAAQFYNARREGDDIVMQDGRRLPMLRQRVGEGLSLDSFRSLRRQRPHLRDPQRFAPGPRSPLPLLPV